MLKEENDELKNGYEKYIKAKNVSRILSEIK